MKKIIFSMLVFLTYFTVPVISQTLPFAITLEPLSIPTVGGLQSYAFAQYDGKWLIIGGRLDGLHRRQPFASFDVAGNNNQLFVIDPIAQLSWSYGLDSLPVSIKEQFSSTNMEFHQDGNFLYLIGGYGFNTSTGTRKTFDQLSVLNVPQIINAVVNLNPITPYIRQITDTNFAVTGGHLKKINNTYYLLAGNKFDGDYNPMGHATYVQQYTNSIRKFTINDDGTNILINHLVSPYDSTNLHRRDYNAVPTILPGSQEAITIFSGVFQPTIDLPYLNSVLVDSISYYPNSNFQQHYNHYHCAVLPMYNETENEMYSVFFGGIAQFYDSLGIMVQDNNVPFVKTIATVIRDSSGNMMEEKMGEEMPGYFGASSEFIPIESISHYSNDVLKFDSLNSDTTLVGFIYGGISSTASNIFFTNSGSQSSAGSQIFKVFVVKNSQSTGISFHNDEPLVLDIYPNPNKGDFKLKINMKTQEVVRLEVLDMDGKLISAKHLKDLSLGENIIDIRIAKTIAMGRYLVKATTANATVQRIVVVED